MAERLVSLYNTKGKIRFFWIVTFQNKTRKGTYYREVYKILNFV